MATTCTSDVTDMSYIFDGATSFNQNLNSWDVSSVTNMSYMFYTDTGVPNFCTSSFNQNLSGWCVSLIGSRFDPGWLH